MVKMNATAPERLREHRERSALPLSLSNARQLGGIVLRDGRRVRDGLLLRTSRLADASEEDLRVLRERYRLSLILDMRGESEIRRAPDPDVPGAKWVQTDIIDFAFLRESLLARAQGHASSLLDKPDEPGGERMLDWMIETAREGARSGRSDLGLGSAYAAYLESALGRENLGLFFHELAANESGAALWHCHTGKDRTGIAAGLILEVLGADWETIAADYETSNLYYADDVAALERRLREKGVEEEIMPPVCGFVGVHLPMLENAWKYMEREWGGPIGYLTRACGVTQDELAALRERYIEDGT